jgi:TRAP-type C4-dicarboxylate transport system permease small subunit
MPTEPTQKPPGWTEQRIARLITMAVSGAVVVADIWLLVVFIIGASGLPGGWLRYWYLPAGILGIFFFAGARFLRHLKAYRRGE